MFSHTYTPALSFGFRLSSFRSCAFCETLHGSTQSACIVHRRITMCRRFRSTTSRTTGPGWSNSRKQSARSDRSSGCGNSAATPSARRTKARRACSMLTTRRGRGVDMVSSRRAGGAEPDRCAVHGFYEIASAFHFCKGGLSSGMDGFPRTLRHFRNG